MHNSSFCPHYGNDPEGNLDRVNDIAFDFWFNEDFYKGLYFRMKRYEDYEKFLLKHEKLTSFFWSTVV